MKDPQSVLGLYAKLMEEIKPRLNSLKAALECKTIPPFLIKEYCMLQFRMIAELIALACLTAHGDVKGVNSLKKEGKADKTINALGKLHAGFYPEPHDLSQEGSVHTLTPFTGEFLSKEELIRLHHDCGDVLHRGSWDRLVKGKKGKNFTLEEIDKIAVKIANFLNVHRISLYDGTQTIVCIMVVGENEGKCRVALTELINP